MNLVLGTSLLLGCRSDRHGPDPGWRDVGGGCEVASGGVPMPLAPPATCARLPPSWANGPVEAWAFAVIRATAAGDTLGYDLATMDPDGDGVDGLVVGAPHFALPPTGTGYTYAIAEGPHPPRVLWIPDVTGVTSPDGQPVLVAEEDADDVSIGQAVGVLGRHGPALAGDAWVPAGAGTVYVVDVVGEDVDRVVGDVEPSCGAGVDAADIDASGGTDLVAACVGYQGPPEVRVWEQSPSGAWSALGTLTGAAPDLPYAGFFGREVRAGFELDGDGTAELAVGTEHDAADLLSSVHVIRSPWRGTCALDQLDVVTLGVGFTPAALQAGDLDGDGRAELLVAQPGMPAWTLQPEASPGRVDTLREATAGPARDSGWLAFEGQDPTEAFGSATAVGDFNDDGCADVAVGAPGTQVYPGNPPGQVYVFHGPFLPGTRSAEDADVVLVGASDDDGFGARLEVGDYTGDGVDDLTIAAPLDARRARQAGVLYVLAGQASPGG